MNHFQAFSPLFSVQKNLILIGFMGSGKSTIGHALSKALGYPHLDTDELIVREAGLSIPEIFERHGEEHFRELETATLRGLRGKTHQIISTGGGIIGRPENRALLQELGYVVWLSARPEEILQRTSRNSNRPLLQTENPLETIHTLLSARLPHYEKTAHLKVETGGLDSSEISAGIIDSARYHFSHHDD
ncbi:MAG: shikimate kinase [Verrucomicrobiales bacterium]